jgi:hypothetical protein
MLTSRKNFKLVKVYGVDVVFIYVRLFPYY